MFVSSYLTLSLLLPLVLVYVLEVSVITWKTFILVKITPINALFLASWLVSRKEGITKIKTYFIEYIDNRGNLIYVRRSWISIWNCNKCLHLETIEWPVIILIHQQHPLVFIPTPNFDSPTTSSSATDSDWHLKT